MLSRISATIVLAAFAATAMVATSASAAEEVSVAGSAWDLRILAEDMPSYDVREDATGAGGTTTYEWGGTRGRAWQFGVEGVRAQTVGVDRGSLIYGLRFDVSGQDTSPTSYSSGGVTYQNTTHQSITWLRYGVGAVAGWQTNPVPIQDITLIGELSAYGEIGQMHVTSQDDTASGSSMGLTTEYGLRAGILLGERSWYGGLMLSLVEGWANATVDSFGGTATSELHLHRQGLGMGLIVGRRF